MATKNYLSETGLATLWSQINKKCSKYLTEIPVATSTTIGGVKSGEGLSLSTVVSSEGNEKVRDICSIFQPMEWELCSIHSYYYSD